MKNLWSSFYEPSLRKNIMAFTVLLVFISVFVLTTILTISTYRVINKQADREREQILKQSSFLLSEYLETQRTSMRLWASQPVVKVYFSTPGLEALSRPGLNAYFSRVGVVAPWIDSVLLVNGKKITAGFSRSRNFASSAGKVLGQAADLSIFDASIGNAGTSDVKLLLKHPLNDHSGSDLGQFLLLLVDLEELQRKLFGNIRIGSGGFIRILAKMPENGIWTTNSETTLTRVAGDIRHEYMAASRQWKNWEDIVSNYSSFKIEIQDFHSGSLALASVSSKYDSLAPVMSQIRTSSLFGIIILVLSVGLAIYLTNRIHKPLVDFVDNVDSLDLRNFGSPSFPKKPSSYKEINILNQAFINMLEKLAVSQKQLAESERRFEISQSFAKIGSWDWDLKTNAVYWSSNVAPMYGFKSGETESTYEQFLSAIHEEDRQKVMDALEVTLEQGKEYEAEYRVVWPDGTERWLFERGNISRDEMGKPMNMLGVVQDITSAKETEETLRRALRMEAVGQLTGGISHDFNNLLGVIIGNTELLEKRLGEDTRAKKHLNSLKRAVSRASSLIHRLLAFSRQQALLSVTSDVTHLIRHISGMMKQTLGTPIELGMQLSPDLWLVLVDPHQFNNALMNLTLNARDAMPKGGLLTITAKNITFDKKYADQHDDVEPGDYVSIVVNDTGTGMSAEVQERVFEPFFTTKDIGEGSGLGLSMVFGFAMQSKGHVTIQSEEGQGTEVSLFLPRSYE